MPDAYASFGGTDRVISGSYSLAWGTTPGQARLSVGVGFGRIGQIGDLKFFFRSQSFTLHDAIVVEPTISGGSSEVPRTDFVALDRRWKWQFRGLVKGDWNFEKKDGSLLRQQSPRSMAAMLFDALGEVNYDVTAMPDTPRPRVIWDHVSPRDELNRLCADFGCVVCFSPISNRAYIVKIGVGVGPPAPKDESHQVNRSDSQIWPVPPDGVRIVGGEAIFQTALALGEAVGREVDGSYQPIDRLSYKPPGGWTSIQPWEFNDIETEYTDAATGETLYHRGLAQASVWRCYRISGQKAGGFAPAMLMGQPNAPTSILDLGPFTGSILDKDPVTNERLPSYARGVFADERLAVGASANTKRGTRFPGSISIDSEQRIVTFDAPLYKYNANERPEPADVELIAAYQCSKDGVPIRWQLTRPTGYNNGAGEQLEHHDEIVLEVVEKTASSTGAARSNVATVETEMNYYLDAIVSRYQQTTATVATYGGLLIGLAYSLGGQLRSVAYSFSASGAPTTTFSWNCERSRFVIPWEKKDVARQQRAADFAVRRAAAQAKISASRIAVRKAAT